MGRPRMNVALTLPGVDAGIWQIRNQSDKAILALANRHYSREVVNWKQAGGPGYKLVLLTPCGRAAWITKRHSPDVQSARVTADGYPADTYRCALFRNEGAGLSSALILEAMRLTVLMWGSATNGWQTYVDAAVVQSSNPGYCFKRAGWREDGYRGTKLSLVCDAQ